MMRSRAYRRFQEKKARRRILELLKQRHFATSEISAREIGLMTNCHRKPCSCVQCGNPRRYGELPPAERRAALNQRDTGEEDFPAA